MIVTKVENEGFPYASTFMPMTLTTLTQEIDPETKKFSVRQTIEIQVKFIKTVRFFKNKIKTKAHAEMEANTKEVLIPLIKACLTSKKK